MNELQIFNFESNEVRTQLIDDEPWFVGRDVAEVLGYSNTRDALNRHVDLEDISSVVIHDGTSGNPLQTIINESGLYSLILKSKLPNAKKFKRWVTSEVLPTIRKTGSYQAPISNTKLLLRASLEHEEKIESLETDVEDLKKEIDLSRLQKSKLSKLVRSNVMSALGGKKSNAYKELKGKAFAEHWRAIKNAFEVASYEEIPKLKYAEAMEMAEMWVPSMELAYEIKKANS